MDGRRKDDRLIRSFELKVVRREHAKRATITHDMKTTNQRGMGVLGCLFGGWGCARFVAVSEMPRPCVPERQQAARFRPVEKIILTEFPKLGKISC